METNVPAHGLRIRITLYYDQTFCPIHVAMDVLKVTLNISLLLNPDDPCRVSISRHTL